MNRERILLVVRFFLVVVFALAIGFMLARAWIPRSATYWLVHGVSDVFSFGPGVDIQKFSSTVIGIYAGLLVLFTLDWRKRVQGILLSIGTALGLGVLWYFDVLVSNIRLTPVNVAFLFGGILVAFAVQYPTIRRQFEAGTPIAEFEFDGAILSVFVLFAGLTVWGLVQVLLEGESVLLLDVPATAAFVYALFGFISYDSTTRTAVLGPQSSGKTMLILGLFQRFSMRDDIPIRATDKLNHLVWQADRMAQGNDFPAPHTKGTNNEVGFYFQVGDLFPMRARFWTLDHAGEFIDNISDAVEQGPSILERFRLFWFWIQARNPVSSLTPREREVLFYDHVRNASIVVLVIDVARILHNEDPYLDHLETIASELNQRNAKVRIVATKCDLLLDQYTEKSDVITDPEADGVLYPDEDVEFTAFSEWLTNSLTSSRLQVRNLMKETDSDVIYPVWFRTVEDEDGNLVPELDEDGNLQPVGFDILVEELEAEALRNVRI
jgi:GTPase SAR1 family protein